MANDKQDKAIGSNRRGLLLGGSALSVPGTVGLGDRDEHPPTDRGFDEFFGNLHHLNAEEEPEGYFYPKDPESRKKYGPRGVLKTCADGKTEGTGPLNTKRMEPYERGTKEGGGAMDVIARQMRILVPIQAKLGEFFSGFEQFPCQTGSSLNAANINYSLLWQQDALKRLKDMEKLRPR